MKRFKELMARYALGAIFLAVIFGFWFEITTQRALANADNSDLMALACHSGATPGTCLFQVDASGNIVEVNNITAAGIVTATSFVGSGAALTGVPGVGTTLAASDIWIGNASNQATAVAMTGATSISNAGVVTLATSQTGAHSWAGIQTLAAQLQLANYTATQITTLVPGATGALIYDSTAGVLCMSTGTVSGAWGLATAKSSICN